MKYVYKNSPSRLKKFPKNNIKFNPEIHFNEVVKVSDILLFIETIIKRHHLASREDLIQILNYHKILFVPHNKYENFKGDVQYCLMYRDLCLLYKNIDTQNVKNKIYKKK